MKDKSGFIGALMRFFKTKRPVTVSAAQELTRDSYIESPSPIENELHEIFSSQNQIVIFDIGACEGEDSIRYAKLFPKASIFSFEPIPENVSIICKQIEKHGVSNQISISKIALSDSKGTAIFHKSSGAPEHLPNTQNWDYGNKAGSLLAPDKVLTHYPWLKFDQAITVETETIHSFCQAKKIERIDFIHMDVQGAELKVLQGAGPILNTVKVIWLEVENVELYKNQPLAQEIEAFMTLHRFSKLKDTVSDITGDQLYVRI